MTIEGSDSDPFADLDEDEDQAEKNWALWVQSACAKASVHTLELYLPSYSIRVRWAAEIDKTIFKDSKYSKQVLYVR